MYRGLWLALVLLLPAAVQASTEAEELRSMLERLRSGGLWGEAELEDGRLRAIQVDSLSGDSVVVREVAGALHQRREVYALNEIRSLRELGEHRIPLHRAPFQAHKSMATALVLETIVPGGGYFYIGEPGHGLVLVGLAAAAVGTGLATGKDGAAGWVPISAWIKIASLFHLRDEVRALNRTSGKGRRDGGGGSGAPAGHYMRSFRAGVMAGEEAPVPALQVHISF